MRCSEGKPAPCRAGAGPPSGSGTSGGRAWPHTPPVPGQDQRPVPNTEKYAAVIGAEQVLHIPECSRGRHEAIYGLYGETVQCGAGFGHGFRCREREDQGCHEADGAGAAGCSSAGLRQDTGPVPLHPSVEWWVGAQEGLGISPLTGGSSDPVKLPFPQLPSAWDGPTHQACQTQQVPLQRSRGPLISMRVPLI
ncbi:hypothetical protein MC885_010179 [Smutsia gigantea]|nr:hypothetical protein MC885_010179 [Smutsia gigantea]